MEKNGIERRLQLLEDREAIRQLKALYCLYADQPGPEYADRFAGLFVEDAEIDEGEELGVLRGRENIRQAHRIFWQHLRLNQHLAFNPVIEVRGDEASGHWQYLHLATTIFPDGDRAFWSCGTYEERYTRREGRWKIQHVKARDHFTCPYEDGWARTPHAPLLPAEVIAEVTGESVPP